MNLKYFLGKFDQIENINLISNKIITSEVQKIEQL